MLELEKKQISLIIDFIQNSPKKVEFASKMKFVIATILLTIIVVKADPQVSGTDATDITTGLTGAVAGLQSLGQAILDLVKQFPVLIDVFVKLVEIIRDVIPYLPKIVEGIPFFQLKANVKFFVGYFFGQFCIKNLF